MEKNDCGALWVREGRNGKFLSGTITIGDTAHQIVVFKNGYKEKPNQPDWRIYRSQKRGPEAGAEDLPF
jgi:hypothetical protein